jgi:hypothetical protein
MFRDVGTWTVMATASMPVLRDNTARAAYLLVERIYLWFGVPTNEIPYTVGEAEEKALDLEMIRRGGKPPAG